MTNKKAFNWFLSHGKQRLVYYFFCLFLVCVFVFCKLPLDCNKLKFIQEKSHTKNEKALLVG